MNENDNNAFDEKLMASAAKLGGGVRPARDLWPEIAQRIGAATRSGRSVWSFGWAQAAAVVLLVGGSSGVTYFAMHDGGDPATTVAGATTLVFEPVSGSFGSQYNLGPDYRDARRNLAAGFDAGLGKLAPETRAEVVTNLDAIRQAIADINRALDEEPDSVLLQELLLDVYRDELSLMNSVDVATRAAMRRGDI
jgi:hypothetical protein